MGRKISWYLFPREVFGPAVQEHEKTDHTHTMLIINSHVFRVLHHIETKASAGNLALMMTLEIFVYGQSSYTWIWHHSKCQHMSQRALDHNIHTKYLDIASLLSI
jgi:hypothetical protein